MAGDGAGEFADLYEPLRRFAAVVASPGTDADDLVQEALVRTLTLQPLADLDDPASYLRTVIVRLASNERRSAGRRRRALLRLRREEEHQPLTYPSDLAELGRLEPRDRAAVYLSAVEQRSHREIAAMLECSEEASRQRVARALARLRVELATENDDG